MKYWLGWILIPLLVGCKSNVASESISQSVISDLNAHQQAISILDKQTTKECKTDAFLSSLNALKTQTESIAGQVKSISKACNAEKEVLKRDITIREIMIMVLLGILCLFVYLFFRHK